MTTIVIDGREFVFDESLNYLDFFYRGGIQHLVTVLWSEVLADLAAGKMTLSEPLLSEIVLLDRWVEEAPRKLNFRNMILSGEIKVLTQERFFLEDDGAETISALENTGRLARRFLEVFAPALAARCKIFPHPARQHMIGYSDLPTMVNGEVPGA